MSDRSEYWREYARTHREQRREIERRRDAKRRAARVHIVKTCVGCGVEFTPHHNGQKFCTAECRTKARKQRISNHEPRTTTDIETVHEDVNVQIGVGLRTCIVCGKTFAKDMQHPKRRKCPDCFKRDPESKNTEVMITAVEFRGMKRRDEIEEIKRIERQRKRDAAWTRWELANGFKPRFEDNGDKIVEIRGRCS